MLALFPSSTTSPSRGTVLVFPGGGYVYLAYDEDGRDVAELLNEAGYDAAMLFYRVSEGSRTRDLALDDATRALAVIREYGPKFGLETNLIGVMGFSAGGHLAARLVHETADMVPPDFAVLLYPAYLETRGKLSVEVIPSHVPVFLYVAADDDYVKGSRAYAASCRARGIPAWPVTRRMPRRGDS